MGRRVKSAPAVIHDRGRRVLRRALGSVPALMGRRCGAERFLPIARGGGVAPRGVATPVRACGAAVVCVIVGLWLGSGEAAASSWAIEQVPVPALPYGQ